MTSQDIVERLQARLEKLERNEVGHLNVICEQQCKLIDIDARLRESFDALNACRNELQDVTQAMDDPSVNNSRDLEDAIHAMKARLADAEARCCEIESRYDRLTVAYGKKCAELEEAMRTINQATQSPS